MKKKLCVKCKKEKPLKRFHTDKRRKGGRCSYCIECHNEYRRGRRKIKKVRDRELNNRLKGKYNITLVDYDNLSIKQNHVCAICKQSESNKTKSRLSVDHDHKNKKVRGLLCDKCNRMIGQANDNTHVLYEAIKYLKSYR